ncbi:Ribosomal silencing factor RsfS [Tepidimonas thermarum]|uniref:Ribosomal silencing factor RsfS n=1 Tax=Tepidimonas thermarum TaxID=335431 RepID=A0A554X0I2_9BURK|nr:Ribosomal silencing factor RsfS [Tepidimonas thermarum]
MTATAAQRHIQKLQRAIVDGLEDVKAQDIRVFNTEAMTPLFERVIIASGTSNRQTKALAASVRDKVAEAGFAKPRVEGEDNGEWIIVDCGAAVVHVMQPAIRQYYRLEDIWGGKPVRLRKTPPPAVAQAASAVTAAKPARTRTPRQGAAEAKGAAADAGGARRRKTRDDA